MMRFFMTVTLAAAPLLLTLLGLFVATGANAGGGSPDPGADRWSSPSMARYAPERDRGKGDDDDDDDDDGDRGLARFFVGDPFADPTSVVKGDAADRLSWNAFDEPAFPGDLPGSLSALYDSSLPAGLFGYTLPQPFDAADTFTAATVFVIDPDTFAADPEGFFQISWGLWNTATTGLNRTGNFDDFASDSFELIEFDWFPNVSEFFGGPFLGPTVLGAPASDPPDAFTNAAFLFGLEAALPLGVPLLAVLEHRPEDDALVTQVYRVVERGRVLPIDGAVGVTSLAGMSLREYTVDAIGLTLWQDGFGGPEPAVRATLDFHAIVVRPGADGDRGF